MNVILDKREHALIDIFPDTETQQLDIGDIILYNSTQKYIIERKTLNDMSSSIIDGRYREQKQRLLASGHRIIYIIEGFVKNKYGVKYSTLLSAMLNMQFKDNIIVIRSKDTTETGQIIQFLKEKLNSSEISIIDTLYNPHISIKKKNNMSKDIVFMNQLSCIPGISKNIATCIINEYPTLSSLYKLYSLLDEKSSRKALMHIDGIGYKISNTVFEHIAM